MNMTNEYQKGSNNQSNYYKDMKGDFDQMLNTMDCRENINPNVLINYGNSKNSIQNDNNNSNGRTSNSKVILAK